jgi:hypothetical protein
MKGMKLALVFFIAFICIFSVISKPCDGNEDCNANKGEVCTIGKCKPTRKEFIEEKENEKTENQTNDSLQKNNSVTNETETVSSDRKSLRMKHRKH